MRKIDLTIKIKKNIFMKPKNNSIFFTDKEESQQAFHLSNQFAEHLEFNLVRDKITATPDDAFHALSMSVRDRLGSSMA